MNRTKKWYDYLWIASLTYLILGFFNILFAWLGLLCFFIPLLIAIIGGNKAYCNRYCGRGQLFALLGGRFGLSRRRDVPRWMKSRAFRYGFLVFFFVMFFLMLWNTYLVFAGAQDLRQVVTLLWTFKLPWQLVRLLPHGHHDTADLPGAERQSVSLSRKHGRKLGILIPSKENKEVRICLLSPLPRITSAKRWWRAISRSFWTSGPTGAGPAR